MSEMVPKVRFQGFTDDWEQRKLGEVTTRVRGNNEQMNLPTLTMSAGSGWLDQKDRFSGDISGKEKKNYTLLSKGELSYNHGNSKLAKYGVVFVLRNYDEALVPRVYHSFKTNKEAFGDFIEYMFATKLPDRELAKLVSSGARMDGLLNINYDDFMSINITIPSISEQKQISSLFRQLDNLITLHQRKLDLLKEQKKGFLQKMFPKDGQLVPEVRFAGFADDWEQRKFGDVVDLHEEIVSGKTGLPIATSSRKGLFLQNEFFSGNRTGIDENTIFHKVPVGFITYRHMSDDSIFKFNENIFDTAVLVSKEYPVFKSNEHSNQTFLLTHLNNSPEFLKFSTQQKLGGTRVRLYFKNLKKYELKVPSKEEQDSIGLFFKQLDNLITLHQRKLDLLKEQKKGFLQKMFVS